MAKRDSKFILLSAKGQELQFLIDQGDGATNYFITNDEDEYREREAMFVEDSVGIEQELKECERLIMAQMDKACQSGLTALN